MRYLLVAALAAAGLVWLAWLRQRYLAVIVEGVSMVPTLRPGQRLLARRAAGVTGDIVVVRNRDRLMVKRLAAREGERLPAVLGGGIVPAGRIAVLGDNPSRSADSRQFGLLPASAVVAVVRSVPSQTSQPKGS
ncbi:S26 family signal peptidase [Nonomuraea sp. NPDC005983]|uniref:S26 family signal peptidase n=1 Tax=Nonomuraea sp. NPDC005983 TaxID=3155595 RepID=UPI0033B0A7E1